MTLIDTSRWVNHLRSGDAAIRRLIEAEEAGGHPFVLGEIACGKLKNRAQFMADYESLPQAGVAFEEEVRFLLESRHLWGRGLGWVDLHILTAAKVAGWRLYTGDRALARAAAEIGVECV